VTRIAYLPGDGIGPEVLAVARRVLEAAGFQAEWTELPVGWSEWCRRGDALPAATLAELRRSDAALFGAITSKPADEAERELDPALRGRGLRYVSPILRLRQEFDLGVNLRPVRSLPGNPLNLRDDVDLVIFRENTEDVYAGVEAHPFPPELHEAWLRAGAANVPAAGAETAVTLRVTTKRAVTRIMEAAFAYAAREGRRRVTLVEKANVMRATGGLVRRVFRETAAAHPGIEAEDLHIDAACARLVREPQHFDVVVATNLFGDILSDLAAEVAGGLPLAASANLGDRFALFEPVHGSAPDIAGRGVANPLGAVLAGAMLARRVGQPAAADRVESAMAQLMSDAAVRPADLGGTATTRDVEAALLAHLSLVAHA
jgi:isocitrate/isopropylmalate dehydrogenase